MRHRMAVLGTGGLGTRLGEQLRRQPAADLVAIADIDAESRARAGERLAVPPDERYETLVALLDGADLDALVIATPHTLHYEQVLAALDRDLHVLCEKPLVTDLERARELDRRSSATDRVVMVGYQRHLEPEFQLTRSRWADSAAVPTFVSVEITEPWFEPNVGTWRVDPGMSGGGFLYDTGSHVVDALLWTTGLTPTRVLADMDFETEGIDVRANLTVEFEEGATAHLSVHGDVAGVTERMQGWDADGAVRIEGRGWGPRSVTIVAGDGTESSPYLKARESAYEQARTKPDAFVDAIEAGTPPPATTRDALRATAVTEAAYESERTGFPASVDLQS